MANVCIYCCRLSVDCTVVAFIDITIARSTSPSRELGTRTIPYHVKEACHPKGGRREAEVS
eukprot:scaffold6781_cov204-Amphora_coffeaeformis.AAC.15